MFLRLLAILGLFIFSMPAASQSYRGAQCRSAQDVEAYLLGHKELPGSQIGVTTSGEEVRIFADLDETTWSLVIYSPNGIAACVVLVGIGPFPSPNLPGRKIRN